MGEQMVWDLDRPTPNVALERIRLALLSTDDIYLVLDALLGLLDDATAERQELRDELDAATADRQQLRDDLAALAGRVAALEPPPVPADPPEPLP